MGPSMPDEDAPLFVAAAASPRQDRWLRLALFALWLAAMAWIASDHVFWRDEIRAFTLALQGDTYADMLRGVQGEGHPALWYILLRVAHDIAPFREVLPIVAALIAVGAMALLVWRAPFPPLVIALILFGQWALIEYAVTARNYGISMLLLFALAAAYRRFRDRGPVLGILLALLCNTNVPAVLLAGAFMLFWLVELIGEHGTKLRAYRVFAMNAGIMLVGVIACVVTVYPPANDAAVAPPPESLLAVIGGLLAPGTAFADLAPLALGYSGISRAVLSLIIFGSLIGLIRAPGAFLSALAVLLSFELFFVLIYPGGYRHQALLIVYLVAMYWLTALGRGGRWPARLRVRETRLLGGAVTVGGWCFVALLALQTPNSAGLASLHAAGVPESRVIDLVTMLDRERLNDAILIGEPSVLLEPVPYYRANPIYLIREQRFGHVVRFSRLARNDFTLDGLLSEAQALRARWRRPVVIVLQHELDPAAPPILDERTYGQTFAVDSGQIRRFLAATRLLARFAPASSDESYNVYLLPGPTPAGPADPPPPS